MIVGNSLRRLLVEKDMSLELLSQVTGIHYRVLMKIIEGKSITTKNIDTLCKVLNCQPCDIIEYVPDDRVESHWEWIV